MNYRIITIIFICFLACKQTESPKVKIEKPILDKFGVLKIGMSLKDFYDLKLNAKEGINDECRVGYDLINIKINKKITLKKVYVEFIDAKLAYIGTQCNDDFLLFLKSRYGKKGDEILTNTEKIKIFFGSDNGNSPCLISLYEKNWWSAVYYKAAHNSG